MLKTRPSWHNDGVVVKVEWGMRRSSQIKRADEWDASLACLVVGQIEPLTEICAHTPLDTAWLAWHLGNRHTDV